MAPNDRYLCIVPGRGEKSEATGDPTLALILSKACLRRRHQVTDPTITRRIGMR